MMIPPLATAAATSAISSGVAWTLCWPMADLARPGRSWAKAPTAGKNDWAAPGRSMGGVWSKPKLLASAVRSAAPRSRPMAPKPVLHDTRNRSGSAPPHTSPPKLFSTWPSVLGRARPGRVG